MKHATTLLAAVLLAVTVAFGASALDSGEVQAADTVNVRACTGGKIALKADEKRMLELHNHKRRSQELGRLCVHPALQRDARDHSQNMIRKETLLRARQRRQTPEAPRLQREQVRREHRSGFPFSLSRPDLRYVDG